MSAASDPPAGRGALARGRARAQEHRDRAAHRVDEVESRKLAGVPIATVRRFGEIDGKELASLLTLGLLVAALPLVILLYALGSTSVGSGNSLGDALVEQFHFSGTAAQAVHATFPDASASRAAATVLTIAGLVYGGLDVASVVHTAFARAFRITPLSGMARVVRGLPWFLILIANLLVTEVIQDALLGRGIPLFMVAVTLQAVLAFLFWLATPRLLLHRRLGFAGLLPMALAGTGITFVTRLASKVWFPHLVRSYIGPYGPFGVVLSLVSWCIILTASWLLVACLGAVLWERFGDPAIVRSVETARPPDGEAHAGPDTDGHADPRPEPDPAPTDGSV